MRGEERLLGRVFRLGAVAQQRAADDGDRVVMPSYSAAVHAAAAPSIGAAAGILRVEGGVSRRHLRRRARRGDHRGRRLVVVARSSSATLSVTVWPTSDAGRVRPAGSGTVTDWPWTSSVTLPAATAFTVAWIVNVLALTTADLVLVLLLDLPFAIVTSAFTTVPEQSVRESWLRAGGRPGSGSRSDGGCSRGTSVVPMRRTTMP